MLMLMQNAGLLVRAMLLLELGVMACVMEGAQFSSAAWSVQRSAYLSSCACYREQIAPVLCRMLFAGLLAGATLTHWFSAIAMTSTRQLCYCCNLSLLVSCADLRRFAGGRHAAVLVQRHDHEERGQGRAGHGGGGAPPVQHHPRHHGGHRPPRLPPLRRDLHPGAPTRPSDLP